MTRVQIKPISYDRGCRESYVFALSATVQALMCITFLGLAWLIIPSNFTTLAPYGETWRFFIIVCAIPSLSSSLFFYFMPESPKFLMQKGKSEEAYKVLKRIHSINNPGEPFPVCIFE